MRLIPAAIVPASIGSSVRLALARHRWLRRTVVTTCVAIVGLVTWSQLAAVSERAGRWDETVPVLVATVDLEPGDAVSPGSTRLVPWPRAVAPPSALRDGEAATTVVRAVSAGDAITALDVATAEGAAAFLAPGDSGVAVPVDTDLLGVLTVGDRVGVVVAGRHVADGTVAHVGSAGIVVAVAADAAPQVADAVLLGTVTVVLRPGR